MGLCIVVTFCIAESPRHDLSDKWLCAAAVQVRNVLEFDGGVTDTHVYRAGTDADLSSGLDYVYRPHPGCVRSDSATASDTITRLSGPRRVDHKPFLLPPARASKRWSLMLLSRNPGPAEHPNVLHGKGVPAD